VKELWHVVVTPFHVIGQHVEGCRRADGKTVLRHSWFHTASCNSHTAI